MDFKKFISFPVIFSADISISFTREESINFSWAKPRCSHSLLSIDSDLAVLFVWPGGGFSISLKSSARDTVGNYNFNNLNINNQFDGIQILRYRRNNQHGLDEDWTGEGLESRWDN